MQLKPSSLLILILVFSDLYIPFFQHTLHLYVDARTTKKPTKDKKSTTNKSVQDRSLVTEKVTYSSILREHQKYSQNVTHKNFNNDVLAYVTPWNNHGYEMAKIFARKFTYVSPTWYVIKRTGDKMVIQGSHNVDKDWLNVVRSGNSTTKIVPRFLFDDWTLLDFQDLFNDRTKMDTLVAMIVEECKKNDFNGIVLDSGSLGLRNFHDNLFYFLVNLSNHLHDIQQEIILVIPVFKPFRSGIGERQAFDVNDFNELQSYIDKFSLMTPGPNSPIPWVTQSIYSLVPLTSENGQHLYSHKILVGMNFYGNDFVNPLGGGPIINSQYLPMLKKYMPKFRWDTDTHEHSFVYQSAGETHTVYYPTLKSIYDRILLATELGVGISIWEVGQGLDYFFDLF